MLCQAFLSSAAPAYTIAFASLNGGNDTPYTGHIEGNFRVAPTSGDWRQAQQYGNPAPDIFAGPVGSVIPASLDVTELTTGLFRFSSFDFSPNGSTATVYQITGFRSGNSVLSFSGSAGVATQFQTILSSNSTTVLDRLTFSFTPNGASSYNVDNIVVNTAVPEPTTVVLLTIAIGATGIGGRRRSAASRDDCND
jgi:hypothetical protein